MKQIIYDNYDLWEMWHEDAVNYLVDEMGYDEADLTDSAIQKEIYAQDSLEWDIRYHEITRFFNENYRGRKLMLSGSIGRWDGRTIGFDVFSDFADLLTYALENCVYISLYDIGGHFYIKGSHHDGTNTYEVKVLTERGESYLDNWEWEYPSKRSASYVGEQLTKRYSVLPRFAEREWGV